MSAEEKGDGAGCECELLTSGLVGAAAFPTVLAVMQTRIFKPLRISHGPGLSSPLLGLASVTLASFGASLAALKTLTIVNQYFSSSDVRLSLNRRDLLLSTASGVVVFRALGGRFNAVLPSNLMRPGSFAAEWIPALREAEAASPKEREVIKALGQKHGCHSCGDRRGVEFVADHQPPSRLLGNHRNGGVKSAKPSPLLQRFYPQCVRCSRIQGGILGGGNGKSVSHPQAVRTHARSFRPHHVFLPVPFAIAYLNEANKKTPKLTMPRDLVVTPSQQDTGTSTQSAGEDGKPQAAVETKDTKQTQSPTTALEVVKSEPMVARSENVWLDIEVALNFPLFIVWRKVVHFLDSFNPLASFHMTIWAFTVFAALGTI